MRVFLAVALGWVFFLGLASCQNRPPLPPRPAYVMPLLPPVPSKDLVDKLTKAQLNFIRQHQKLVENDKTEYDPYKCLPKYICIVDEEDGTKRTAIVNGLHPALKDVAFDEPVTGLSEEDDEAIPAIGLTNSASFYNNIDGFSDGFYLNVPKAPGKFPKLKKPKNKKKKIKPDSESEEDEEEQDEESGEYDESGESSEERPESRFKDMSGHGRPGPADYHLDAGVVTVPWDDRVKNSTELQPAPSGGIVERLTSALPLPKLKLPFIGGHGQAHGKPMMIGRPAAAHHSQSQQPTTTPSSIFKRMLSSHLFLRRGKRDTLSTAQKQLLNKKQKYPYITKLGPGIHSSSQCRVLYNGCELNYDQIMQIADEGNVLIEGDDPGATTKAPTKSSQPLSNIEDDEMEQAMKEYQKIRNAQKHAGRFPQPYGNSISSLGSKHANYPLPPRPQSSQYSSVPFGALPLVPMKFKWGKPEAYVNGQTVRPQLFGNKRPRVSTTTPLPIPTTTSTPPPIFVKKPLYTRKNHTITETSIIKINETHALEIKSPKQKPYRPDKADVLDKNGNPLNFATVYTQIAGKNGGIYDYFDKIASSVGAPKNRVQKQFTPRIPKVRPSIPHQNGRYRPRPRPRPTQEDDYEESDESASGEDETQNDSEEEEEDVSLEQSSEQEKVTAEKLQALIQPVQKKKPFKYTVHKKDNQDLHIKIEKKPNSAPVVKHEGGSNYDSNDDNNDNYDDEEYEQSAEEQDDQDEDYVSEEEQSDISSNKGKLPNKGEEEDDDEEWDFGDDSEERRKRIKAAEELELPQFLPEEVKQAIKLDIINGGKKKKDGKPAGMPMSNQQQQQGHGHHGHGQQHGGGGGQGVSFARPPFGGDSHGHYQQQPPKRGGGFFSSLFGRTGMGRPMIIPL